MASRIGIYPGTFDPITKGHLHIIRRASRLVDHLIIGVAANPKKGPLFSQGERLDMVKADIASLPEKHCEISVMAFDGLLMQFAQDAKASCVFRGLRAVSDFEYEFQMAGMNIHLAPSIETVFLMSSAQWQFVSSAFIKEIHGLGGDIAEFVTPATLKRLQDKFTPK